MIIVQLKCTVICSQRLTVNIRLRLETPDRLGVCVSFLTSSCLILFLERIGETSRLLRRHEAGSRLRPRRDFTCVNLCEVVSLHVCSSASVCVSCVFMYLYFLSSSQIMWKRLQTKRKEESVFMNRSSAQWQAGSCYYPDGTGSL